MYLTTRLWGIIVALLLVGGCATWQPHYTLRYPDMTYFEFLSQADALVAENFPQWYTKNVQKELRFGKLNGRYASIKEEKNGTLVMFIYKLSWDLRTVEDLASVLLHEYVHIKIWNDLEDQIPGDDVAVWCRAAVHEMTAYGTELRQTRIVQCV